MRRCRCPRRNRSRQSSKEEGDRSMTLGIVLGVIAAIVALFLIIVAMKPADFRITRKMTMSASPPAVFAQVNDFKAWRAWSPWEKRDPDLKRTYEGPAAGV